MSGKSYDKQFYDDHVDESLRSARIVLRRLWEYVQPASVLDVGCGRGAWLMACRELGSTTLIGLDGKWNDQSEMIDSAIQFRSTDLDQTFTVDRRTDLVISLEVAEHLKPSSAGQFVDYLCQASDAVLFSAAYTGQGGTHHLNEQPHSYWAHLFRNRGYMPFDLFRPVLWGNEDVRFWYQQNTFLYCKEGSIPFDTIKGKGCCELSNVRFMDCIHPSLYEMRRRSIGLRFRQNISGVISTVQRRLLHR